MATLSVFVVVDEAHKQKIKNKCQLSDILSKQSLFVFALTVKPFKILC